MTVYAHSYHSCFITSEEFTLCCVSRFGREFTLAGPLESYSVFYVGGEGATLNNLMLNLTQCQVIRREEGGSVGGVSFNYTLTKVLSHVLCAYIMYVLIYCQYSDDVSGNYCVFNCL